MSRRKRSTEIFSLSFLDCICCGFGAIILLFILTMGVQSREESVIIRAYEQVVQQRMLKLNEYQIHTDELALRLDLEKTKRKRIDAERSDLDALIAKLKQNIDDKQHGMDAFVSDMEQLQKEIAAMQKEIDIEQKIVRNTAIGVPVESNYIAFVVDTSGSMRDSSTNLIRAHVAQKFQEVVEAYPEVKGIQVLDANGRFVMGNRMGGNWLPDSPEMRENMIRAVRLYPMNSDSNPVPGIKRAIRILYEPDDKDMKFGIYVFGDEFTGKPELVLEEIAQLNKNKDGERIARINAVGFPNVIYNDSMLLGQSGLKFAKLMYDLTYQHGGAFIALTRDTLDDIDRRDREINPLPPPRPRRPIYGPTLPFPI